MADDAVNCNIVHYGSSHFHRVTRSVMASEVHALLLGFDNAFPIHEILSHILARDLPIEAFVDSKTVFDLIAKDGKTRERKLQIDVSAMRELYSNGELARIAWIPGGINPTEPLTKPVITRTSPLWKLMETNFIDPKPIGWASISPITPLDDHDAHTELIKTPSIQHTCPATGDTNELNSLLSCFSRDHTFVRTTTPHGRQAKRATDASTDDNQRERPTQDRTTTDESTDNQLEQPTRKTTRTSVSEATRSDHETKRNERKRR